MPQLLLEIFSEEIPARMQAKAQADLERALMDRLSVAGLIPEGVKGFSGPRRLVVVVEGLPARSKDVVEDIKGPKVGAPDAAIQGFLKKAGLSRIEDAHVHDDKKGQIYVAHVKKEGRDTAGLIAEMVPAIVREFHWPKSMRWGPNALSKTGDLRWVRPIQRILCTFDGEVVPFNIDGIKSDRITEGHRVMGRGPFTVRRWDDYSDVLKNKGRVILDREERKEMILTEAKTLCEAQGLELVEDLGLLEEVAGLAEWPVVIIGDMDPAFLDLPPEVIKLSMRTHQKYFAVRDPGPKKGMGGEGQLAPKFIVVANLEATDGGKKIAEGNSRVLSARLNDARFFWDNDRKVSLESRFEKLGQIVFHEKLGSVKDKAERVMALARELAPIVGANADDAERAAKLAKCDLVSDMVGEFAELEGIMGRYYAALQKEKPSVADAVRDHYKPKGPGDVVPSEPVSVAVALADKLDTLVGFWAIDEKPTGSKDPFALRRAALGVIRIVLANKVRIPLKMISWNALTAHFSVLSSLRPEMSPDKIGMRVFGAPARPKGGIFDILASHNNAAEPVTRDKVESSYLDFFADRLKVHLREQGARHDLIDAVFALGEDDLVLIVKRVEALGAFLDAEDGKNLLAGYKRAANILKAEEKKDGESYAGAADAGLLSLPEEKALHAALEKAAPAAAKAVEAEDFAAAMKALAGLRAPVDAFFDKVTVNDADPRLRRNRLLLLAQIRDALHRVADFSKIEG